MEDATQLFELGAVVFGLTEIFKQLVPQDYRRVVTPIIAIIIGGGMNVYLNGYSPEHLMYGLGMGLAASGMYRAVKDTYQSAQKAA